MLFRQIITLTFLVATVVTFQIVEGKRKKVSRSFKRPKDGKVWKLRAGRIESTTSTYVNIVNESQIEDETYNKYFATTGPPQLNNNRQSTIETQSNPSVFDYESARWEPPQVTINARKLVTTTEYSAYHTPYRQDEISSTSNNQNDSNPKFNEEIDDLTKNLQQISNDWYYNVRFHCANSWRTIQDILTENRKALNDWQSTLNNIIEMLCIEDCECPEYDDLGENGDQTNMRNMDYDRLAGEVNATDKTVQNKQNEKSKWYGADREYYNVAAKGATESSKIEADNEDKGSSLKHEHQTQTDNTKQGSLKLHVNVGSNEINSSTTPPENSHAEEFEAGKYDRHSNSTYQGKSTDQSTVNPYENYNRRLKTNEDIIDIQKYFENERAATETPKKNYNQYSDERIRTKGFERATTDNSWWNYYNEQETTESSRERYYDTTEAIQETPWKYYHENVIRETTPYESYPMTTESYWKYYYENIATKETTEELKRPGYNKENDEKRTTEAYDLRKFPNFDKKRLNKTTPMELMVKATSQKATRKRKKKKKKLYSAKKSETVQRDTTTQLIPEDEISSDINLVEALRMYWKQSILECLSKYMKEVKEEEGMARNFNKRMKLITADSLSNFTEGCKFDRNGSSDGGDRLTNSWNGLKERLRSLHQELERRYLNHEVQNLQITMGIETCRQVGLAYENTMHRQVKAIYSTAVKGRYRNKPAAAFKHHHKNPRQHSVKT